MVAVSRGWGKVWSSNEDSNSVFSSCCQLDFILDICKRRKLCASTAPIEARIPYFPKNRKRKEKGALSANTIFEGSSK